MEEGFCSAATAPKRYSLIRIGETVLLRLTQWGVDETEVLESADRRKQGAHVSTAAGARSGRDSFDNQM